MVNDYSPSPGPAYYPKSAHYGRGPSGLGEEYSIAGGFRAKKEEKKTRIAHQPGPQYTLPNMLGDTVDSTSARPHHCEPRRPMRHVPCVSRL